MLRTTWEKTTNPYVRSALFLLDRIDIAVDPIRDIIAQSFRQTQDSPSKAHVLPVSPPNERIFILCSARASAVTGYRPDS